MKAVNQIGQALRQRVSESPRGVAFCEGSSGDFVTWEQVGAAAEAWTGADMATPVGVAFSGPLEMASNLVSALAAGVLVAPLDPGSPPVDMRRRIHELGVSTVVTGPADVPFPIAGVEVWNLDSGRLVHRAGRPVARRALASGGQRPALLMSSSGTTGTGKLVPLTADQLAGSARSVAGHLRLGAGEVGYSPLPLFHINGLVVGVLSAVVSGSSLVVDRRFSRQSFWDVVARRGVTWLNVVPTILAILAAAPDETIGSLQRVRLARSASAPLPKAVASRFERRFGVPVIESYGMTEAASQITVNPLDGVRPGSVGLPVGSEVRIVDFRARSLPVGEGGRVQVRGGNVTSSYWTVGSAGEWAARPATGTGGWLTTGDLGWVDNDGYVYLSGREGDAINRGGEKIQPREVEEVMLSDPRVIAAAVVGRPHPTVGEEPVAYILAAEGVMGAKARAALAGDLGQLCARSLSRFKRPVEITVTESLPAGPTGKIRQAELRKIASGEAPATKLVSSRPLLETLVGPDVLDLPQREAKPRQRGFTMVIDNGMPHGAFVDAVTSASSYVDVVKFGWGTAMVTGSMERKFAALRDLGISYYFGGTLFEKFVMQDRFDSFVELCRRCRCQVVEISDGTISMSAADKGEYIRRCAEEFLVLSEVGFKDADRADQVPAEAWAEAIAMDLEAGATMVITEARESGRSGICNRDGKPRPGFVDTILGSGVDPGSLIFEAPTKDLQTYFITRVGTNANLGNISPTDVVALETLRLGLRSDTLLHFENLRGQWRSEGRPPYAC